MMQSNIHDPSLAFIVTWSGEGRGRGAPQEILGKRGSVARREVEERGKRRKAGRDNRKERRGKSLKEWKEGSTGYREGTSFPPLL